MALIKIQRFFGAVPNTLLNNPEISFKAKGLYAYLNSKPDNWDFSVEGIAAQVKEGIDSVRAGIHELENFGYLKRVKYQNEKGFWEIDYMLFEVPSEEESYLGKSKEGEHPKQYNKEYTKKEYIKEKNIKKEKTIEERMEVLKKGLEPFLEKYGREMLNNFYLYWTEPNETGKKMRFESQKFFDISRRLVTWHSLNVTKGKFAAAPRPAVPAAQSHLANQDNHGNYAEYVAWCERNNISPEPERP
jgi:hypothetical protein